MASDYVERRKEILTRKLWDIISECDASIGYLQTCVKACVATINSLERVENRTDFLLKYPAVCDQFSEVSNCVVELNCSLEIIFERNFISLEEGQDEQVPPEPPTALRANGSPTISSVDSGDLESLTPSTREHEEQNSEEHERSECDGEETTNNDELEIVEICTSVPEPQLSVGVAYSVKVCGIESPDLFYVHCINQISKTNRLYDKMMQHYSKSKINFPTKEAAEAAVGEYCACFYKEHQMWYRGLVLHWDEELTLFLIDYGMVLHAPWQDVQPLCQQFTELPALAVLCRLAHVGGSNTWSQDSCSRFRELISTKDTYELVVTASSHNMVYTVLLMDSDGLNLNEQILNTRTQEAASQDVALEALSSWDPMASDWYSPTNHMGHDVDDASHAVLGYIPQDEKRVCHFYSKKGYCYKSGLCRQEHIRLDPRGYTTDREEVYISAYGRLILPRPGEIIQLEVTNVMTVNRFYAVLLKKRVPGEETLETLHAHLNSRETTRAFKRPTMTPALGQLVLACFSADGMWYRARVVETVDEEGMLQVMFVDYGNTEWVKEGNIREMEPQFLHLPFQAVECEIANVSPIAKLRTEGAEFLRSLVVAQTFNATVVARMEGLSRMQVYLSTRDDKDIAEMIVNKGLGTYRSTPDSFSVSEIVPG